LGILSNFLGWRDGRASDDPSAIVRSANADELEPAIRLILGNQGQVISDQHVSEFLAFASERGIDLELLRIAEQNGKVTLAALPIQSPGRTALMFHSLPPSKAGEQVLSRVIDAVCDATAPKGVDLAQVLLDPTDEVMRRVYAAARFDLMAELIYLQGVPRPDAAPPILPPDFRWVNYTAGTHDQFARTILASYQQSLDCPALNGMRDIDDVLDGHKASGVFDGRFWSLLCQGDEPRGVLLMASSGRSEDQMELVYVGLPPESRGRKLGEILVRQAMATVAMEKHKRLALAVDAKNIPALKLYYRHGMNRITSKLAMMREVRKIGV